MFTYRPTNVTNFVQRFSKALMNVSETDIKQQNTGGVEMHLSATKSDASTL